MAKPQLYCYTGVMSIKKSAIYAERGANLAGKVPVTIVKKFRSQARKRGQKVKTNLAAAAKLWVELPEEVQARLLNQTLDANTFIELVREIVEERIAAGQSAAETLLQLRSKKPSQKG